jgi:glycosyltransferase involved in cell wall biosynthesis
MIPSPPNSYGGIELVLWTVAQKCAEFGHTVYLITTDDSQAKDEYSYENGGKLIVKKCGPSSWDIMSERNMYINYRDWLESEFGNEGIVSNHSWFAYPYFSSQRCPNMKLTHHHHGNTSWVANGQAVPPPVTFPRMCGVSKSHAAILAAQFQKPLRFVYNGIDIPPPPDSYDNKGYLLSLNRIGPEKGIHNCIDVAVQTGYPLKVVGDDINPPNQQYIADIQKRCQSYNNIEYIGLVDTGTKWDYIRGAKALISCTNTINYTEAFWLGAVEGFAMGKPTIAVANGGITELVKNNLNGFLVNNPADMVELLKKGVLEENIFNPEEIRKIAVENFSTDASARGYLQLFQQVLDGDKW